MKTEINGVRFEFGKNWRRFLENLTPERIEYAKQDLQKMLGVKDLKGKTFLDAGCGSGIHSLAARMLGARVHSFDVDADAVNCTKYLKEKFFRNDENWTIEQGSLLDKAYIESLGKFDIVYCWGVVHHTGDMKKAMDLVTIPVKEGGILFISIYNKIRTYRLWKYIKRTYNQRPFMKYLWFSIFTPYFIARSLVEGILQKDPLIVFKEYKRKRGMSYFTDIIDWLGGYPYEVAKPEEVLEFYINRKFILLRLITVGCGLGNNIFVFKKICDKNYEEITKF